MLFYLKLSCFFIIVDLCSAFCPKDGVQGSRGNCYFGISYNDTFRKAEHFCSNFYGHLASISNAFENQAVLNMAIDIFPNADNVNVWLGGTYDGATITWDDGSPDVYQNFQTGTLAGSIVLDLLSRKWSTATWNANLSFVCMEQNQPTNVPPTAACPLYSPCPTMWTYAESLKTCYKLIYNINGQAADEDCRLMGANLASIHSDEENEVVYELTRYGASIQGDSSLETLIGGQRTGTGKTDWKWSDGSSWNYTRWAPNQPDNMNGVEYCQVIWSDNSDPTAVGRWNDCDCRVSDRAAICQQPAKY